MSSNRAAAKPAGARGVRFDIAWSLPHNEFQTPGAPATWWHDDTFQKENHALHRLGELQPFLASRNGMAVVYRVDYDGSGMSERVVRTLGRDVRPVRWSDVRTPNGAVLEAYRKLEQVWRDKSGLVQREPEVRRRPKVRRRRGFWSELGHGMAGLLACASVCLALGGAAIAYRTIYLPERQPIRHEAPDPARYDRATMIVPNENGSCDRLSLDNRSNRVAWQGRVNCAEARQAHAR